MKSNMNLTFKTSLKPHKPLLTCNVAFLLQIKAEMNSNHSAIWLDGTVVAHVSWCCKNLVLPST